MNPNGAYVLYWMISARRLRWNFALQRAVNIATETRRPLIVLEALRSDYPWANDRLHRFVLDGMAMRAMRQGLEPSTTRMSSLALVQVGA